MLGLPNRAGAPRGALRRLRRPALGAGLSSCFLPIECWDNAVVTHLPASWVSGGGSVQGQLGGSGRTHHPLPASQGHLEPFPCLFVGPQSPVVVGLISGGCLSVSLSEPLLPELARLPRSLRGCMLTSCVPVTRVKRCRTVLGRALRVSGFGRSLSVSPRRPGPGELPVGGSCGMASSPPAGTGSSSSLVGLLLGSMVPPCESSAWSCQ